MAERKTVGAGWIKSTERGEYVSLSFKADEIQGLDLANCWVSLVINNKKAKPNHPDYNILASPKEVKAQPQPQAQKQPPTSIKNPPFPKPRNFAPSNDEGEGWG